jgi:hypothetical protein
MTPSKEDLIVAIAMACHQQNKAWCEAHGDMSQPAWADAPEWQKKSAVMGVEAGLQDPRPEASHERWMEHKKSEGWVYGEVKDPEAKTHPCMVPYSDLPPEQKAKDHFFTSMVTMLGLQLGLIDS